MAELMIQNRPGYGRLRKAPVPFQAPTVEDRWWENSMTRRLMPGNVEGILRNGLSGDLTDQLALFNLMLDTWPALQRNVRTLKDAVKSAPFEVHPWSDDDGTEITSTAEDKAALVKRALWGTRPCLTDLEMTFEDLIGSHAAATVTGHAVHEILWETREDAGAGGFAILPRAFRRVAARHYGYPSQAYGQADRLRFNREGHTVSAGWSDFPVYQFICGIYPGHEGHPSVAAPLRSLAKYWIAATFGPEWLLSYAQLFGQPFRWATYPKGDNKAKDAVCGMLANIGAAGWGAFPEGTKLELIEAARTAGELPQKLIIDLADHACNILVLGQTLTSDTGDKGGGSFALGKVHDGVRREILSACAAEVAKTLTHQLCRAVVMLNYGEATEIPEIRAELPEPTDAKAEAERDKVLKDMGLPLPLDWLYERHGVPMPTDGEAVLGGGTEEGEATDDTDGTDKDRKKKPGKESKEEKAPTVTAGRARLPKDFLTLLAEANEAVLEHAYQKGWEALQLDAGEDEPEPTAEN